MDKEMLNDIINSGEINIQTGTLVGTDEYMLIFSSNDDVDKFEEMMGMTTYEMEKMGFFDGYGFDDEYSTCSGCGEIIRTSPTHWGWMADYVITSGEMLCKNCLREDVEDVVEEFINNPKKAIDFLEVEELEALGFVKVSKHDVGLYPDSSNEKPSDIFNRTKNKSIDVVFVFTDNSQFESNYITMIRPISWKNRNDEGEDE